MPAGGWGVMCLMVWGWAAETWVCVGASAADDAWANRSMLALHDFVACLTR
jgi:hypothetical protein